MKAITSNSSSQNVIDECLVIPTIFQEVCKVKIIFMKFYYIFTFFTVPTFALMVGKTAGTLG